MLYTSSMANILDMTTDELLFQSISPLTQSNPFFWQKYHHKQCTDATEKNTKFNDTVLFCKAQNSTVSNRSNIGNELFGAMNPSLRCFALMYARADVVNNRRYTMNTVNMEVKGSWFGLLFIGMALFQLYK